MARYIDADKIDYMKIPLGDVVFEGVAFKEDIDKIPTADVKPVVRGEWLEDRDSGSLKCSVCGHLTDELFDICETKGEELAKVIGGKADDIMFVIKDPYYCSKCGADMRGEKDDRT